MSSSSPRTYKAKYTNLPLKYLKLEIILKSPEGRIRWAKAILKKDNITSEDLHCLCRDNVIAFSVFQQGLVPRPHQLYILECMVKSKRLALNLGRRLGKSRVMRLFVLWNIIYNRLPSEGGGTTFTIICQDLDVGKDLYMQPLFMDISDGDSIVEHNFKGLLGNSFFSSKLISKADKFGKVSGNKISFNIDGKVCHIQVVPPTMKARGREGNILGDEVGFWKYNNACKSDKDFYDIVVSPILSDNSDYICILASTPDGYGDLWEDLFDPNNIHESEFEKIWFPCWVYRKSEYMKTMRTLERKFTVKGEYWKFQQEYECRFVQMRNQFFDQITHIDRFLTHDYVFSDRGEEVGYISVDFGGTMTSHTVISYIVESSNPDLEPSYVKYYKEYPVNEDASIFTDIIATTKRFPNYKKVVVDNKGGRYIVQRLQLALTPYKVEEFNYTTSKQAAYSTFKQYMYLNKIKCPMDTKIQGQLRNYTDKLKPQSKEVSDDIIDTIAQAVYYIYAVKQVNKFEVLDY